ncbi:MAG: hypothetical protein J0G28_13875 [Afipia sp.]|nr:hypothetical protein [Afipia sp.]
MTTTKRILVLTVSAFILVVFATFAINLYRSYKAANEPVPGIIFERSDRPARV